MNYYSDSHLEHTSTSDLSPMLKRVLSSRVLYAVSLPPRRKHSLWKIQNWIILGLVLSLVLLVWFVLRTSSLLSPISSRFPSTWQNSPVSTIDPPAPANGNPRSFGQSTNKNILYGVVFDAGSTGTRVHVFQLHRSDEDPNTSFKLTSEIFEHVQPGLSSYADRPEEAAESLSPLLRVAEEHIPKDRCHSTSVVLRATAGLRLLPSVKADNILASVRRKLTRSCLLLSNNSVSILDGNQEGLYLWTSLNFMTNRMSIPDSIGPRNPNAFNRTVGTLDLGGGSTQITFSPIDPVVFTRAPSGYVTEVRTGQSVPGSNASPGSDVYSHSYLGLGLMSARYSILKTTTKRLPFDFVHTANKLFSPCFPEPITVNWSHAGREWTVNPLPRAEYQTTLFRHEEAAVIRTFGDKLTISDITKYCYAHALLVLRDPVEGDSAAHVFPPSGYVIHRPPRIEDHEFYAFSYIFDLAISVGIIQNNAGGSVTVDQFRDAADRVCSSPDPGKPFECMDLCYITALLHDGYGFSWKKKITLQKKVKTFEISWGLGALFAELEAANKS